MAWMGGFLSRPPGDVYVSVSALYMRHKLTSFSFLYQSNLRLQAMNNQEPLSKRERIKPRCTHISLTTTDTENQNLSFPLSVMRINIIQAGFP